VILTIEPDKPLSVSLKYRNAYEKQVNGAVQFKYTLENGDALLVPPIAHEEIQQLHAGAGEPFTILKTIEEGKQAVWKVERIGKPGAPEKAINTERPASHPIGVSRSIPQNGKTPVAVMQTPEPLSTRQSKAMARQLIAAIDAGIAAVAYAKSQNFPLELTSRDICAIAISGSIQQFREGVY
jgi:hypothetical protein